MKLLRNIRNLSRQATSTRVASSYLAGSKDMELRTMTLPDLLRESADYCPDKDICKWLYYFLAGTRKLSNDFNTLGNNLSVKVSQFDTCLTMILDTFMMEGVSYTYAEMVEKATQIATGLLAAGFKQGDRIGILGPNQSQWSIAMWAVAMAGMQLVTINPMYTAPELEYAINKVDIKERIYTFTTTLVYFKWISKTVGECLLAQVVV